MVRSRRSPFPAPVVGAWAVLALLAPPASTAMTAMVALAAFPTSAAGVQAHPVSVPDSLRRIQEVEPMHGPPGTRVRVSTGNLPLQAAVHLGLGSIGAGFEALDTVEQGMWGELEGTITVPETAPWDRAVVIIAFNAIFAPIALSEPFHATRPDGILQRSGTVTDEGVECLAFRDEEEYLYTLIGATEGLVPGEAAVVQGRYVEAATCGQGTTIEVTRVLPRTSPAEG